VLIEDIKKLRTNEWIKHKGLKILSPMTEKQLVYARSLQEELKRLEPSRIEHERLANQKLDKSTTPDVIDDLLKAIQYEEYMIDSAFEGHFIQDQ